MDLDIVIAHRGNALGLWATIHSCDIDLARTKHNYKYYVVANGDEKLDPDTQNVLHCLQQSGRLGWVEHVKEPLSPPTARQMATERGKGELIFFFDNHCLVGKDYFTRAVHDFETYGMDMLHSTTLYYTNQLPNYEYHLSLDKNFWTDGAATLPVRPFKPYPIAVGGHGGFVVKRSVWEEVGGYWTGFVGYGGEESYFDLKMAMLDKTNYIDPLLIHYHYAGSRGYRRHFTDDYYRNMMMCANIIGGQEWMLKVYQKFEQSTKFVSGASMYDLMMDAQARSSEHAAWFASIRKRTLSEQLAVFKEKQISH